MKSKLKISLLVSMLTLSLFAVAQTAEEPAQAAEPVKEAFIAFDYNTVLAICVAALLFVIILLAFMLKSSIDLYRDVNRRAHDSGGKLTKTLLVTGFFLSGFSALAQAADTTAAEIAPSIPVTAHQFNSSMISMILIVAIVIELFIIFYIVKWIKFFTGIQAFEEKRKVEVVADSTVTTKRRGLKGWWFRVNKLRPMRDEKDLDIGHSYDGIRELDNATPPWFTWSFLATIVIGIIYVWYYNSSAAPTQIEEYEQSVAAANKRIETLMATQSNSVDENTVQMLDDAGIQQGEALFKTKCFMCHGDQGQGGIGPNLTDGFAIHGGSISDIFRVIKYGVIDKGMQSWQNELSAEQIAQLSSYIISIHGSNPPNPKEPQGDPIVDAGGAAPAGGDSTKTAADSTKVAKI